MEYILKVPDQKREFIQELLQAFAYVELTPRPAKSQQKQDATEYLESNPANQARVLTAIEQLESGQYEVHDLLPNE